MERLARVFATQPLVDQVVQRLRGVAEVEIYPDASRIIPREELLSAVARCEVLCTLLHDHIDAGVIDAAKSLRLIANCAITPTNVDVARARERGIVVTGFPKEIAAEATADLQWALLLALARRVVEADKRVRQGLFPGAQSLYFAGTKVSGRTLGSIGLGVIGRHVVERARGFRMRVLYTKPTRLAAEKESELGIEYRSLDSLLRESDFVVVNASYTPQTYHLIGAAQLALLKPTACLINTARGPIIDETALAGVLRARRIAGAALDVHEAEPRVYPGLIELDNVILTPHLGTIEFETLERIESVMADNVIAFLRGERPPNVVS